MTVDEILASGIVTPTTEVTAYLAGRSLGAIPITQGDVTETAAGDTLGHLKMTLPASAEWIPKTPAHPLAAFGQELIVRRGFVVDGQAIGWENLGRFRISQTPRASDGWLEVDAASIDQRLTLARWVVDTRTVGSFTAQARAICAGVVPALITATDRAAAPRTWEQGTTRRESLVELLDAWGASLRMINGQLAIVDAATGATPQGTVRSGDGGTLADCSPVTDGEVTPNAVVASSAPEDSTAPITSMVAVGVGPRRWSGPYGPVPTFYASPLLTTYLQCQAAARTRLARIQAQSPELEVSMVTDPRIRLDSRIRIVDDEGTNCIVRVTSVTHALTPGREPGRLQGLVLSGTVKGESWT